MTGSEARRENNVNLDFPRLARQLQVERDFLRLAGLVLGPGWEPDGEFPAPHPLSELQLGIA